MKLKLSGSKPPSQAGSPPQTPALPTPTGSGGGFRLKIKTSAPPTPVSEHAPAITPLGPPPTKPKRPYNKKAKDDGLSTPNKRSADGDLGPDPKRPALDGPKRISFKVSNSDMADNIDVSPAVSTPRIKIAPSVKRQNSTPKNISIIAKKRAAPRPIGVGYDSEASDAEGDPAMEQQFVLRMPDPDTLPEAVRKRVADDTEYLHKAIEEKRLGPPGEGGSDVSFKFVSRDHRRAVVGVRGQKYIAAMVDLPCVIESLKSWDRRGGWWKVADIAQVLLVLRPVAPGEDADDAAKRAQMPREVDRDLRYAHGITPPMQFVRKRRFRKRVSHRDIEDVEEQVERLLQEDRECEARGGEVRFRVYDGAVLPPPSIAADDLDADGEFVESTEDLFGRRIEPNADADAEGEEDDDLEDALMAGLENLDGDEEDITDAADGVRSSSIAGASSSATPAPQQPPESSSDEDDDDDDSDAGGMGGPAPDEDEVAEANERAAQREEIKDLEREVKHKRDELGRVTNQLLKTRVKANLRALEEELEMKRKAFGMEEGESDEDGDED